MNLPVSGIKLGTGFLFKMVGWNETKKKAAKKKAANKKVAKKKAKANKKKGG